MVGTEMFAAVVTIAEQHGAVVRALGDDNQLSAVGSGGALRYLKNTVGAAEHVQHQASGGGLRVNAVGDRADHCHFHKATARNVRSRLHN
ncbi:AAA family ATPase [Arthrobacter sp. UYCu723]